MPNGGMTGEFKTQSSAASDITTLIKNPSTHYGTAGFEPIVNAGPTDLTKDWWNPEVKTLYDPCPYGYRIPKNGTYNGFTAPSSSGSGTLSYGQTWKSSHFSASGRREYNTGKFNSVGSSGFYWMSTPHSASYGYNSYFYSNYISHSDYKYRTFSFPVRCIID